MRGTRAKAIRKQASTHWVRNQSWMKQKGITPRQWYRSVKRLWQAGLAA